MARFVSLRGALSRLAFAGLVAAAAPLAPQSATAQEPFTLIAPVACSLGVDCWVQNLVDVDPDPAASDYRCGPATYDDHSGTDFRIANTPAMEAGTAVVAAARGRVLRARDGEPDHSAEGDQSGVAGRECGNGVVIAHPGGYETQYCHMKAGSITVAAGDPVMPGTPIGLIGRSGKSAFYHVHMTVRRNGETVDPFTGRAIGEGTCGTPGTSLWANPAVVERAIDAQVIGAGFAADAVEMEDIETGRVPLDTIGPETPVLVFFGRAANLKTGDEQRITVTGPGIYLTNTADPVPSNRAQAMVFAGRRAPDGGFPAGLYTGRYEVLRDGSVIAAAAETLTLGD